MGRNRTVIKTALAALTLAIGLAGPVQAQYADAPPTALQPQAQPKAPPQGDKAVVDDIERTLKELSPHLTVGPKRISVAGAPAGGPVGDVEVPSFLDLAVGKAQSIDLPSDAREVIIGNPATIDVSISTRRRLFVMGRAAGSSNVFVLGSAGQIIARMEVAVGVDAAAVQTALKRALPDETGLVVEIQGPTLILSGSVSTDSAAGRVAAIARQFVAKPENFVNLTKVSREQQVLIQVKVAEVNRTALKEFGVSLSGLGNNPVFQALNLGGTTAVTGLNGTAVGSLTWTGVRGITAALRLLEERNLVHSLAEPNLVAVSGETAQMLAGGEYPIPTAQDNNTITLTYKPFGVSLSFLPVVLDTGRINMKLTTEVSAINTSITVGVAGGYSYNAFTVRRASSTIELPNGGALMIAGLMQNDITQGMTGIPGIMDLPVLGKLFASDSFRRNESELVVFVSATLVRPSEMAKLTAPTDSISPGGDIDRWMFTKLSGRYAPSFGQDAYQNSRKPPFGFIFDELTP